jgi:hypothetical protein
MRTVPLLLGYQIRSFLDISFLLLQKNICSNLLLHLLPLLVNIYPPKKVLSPKKEAPPHTSKPSFNALTLDTLAGWGSDPHFHCSGLNLPLFPSITSALKSKYLPLTILFYHCKHCFLPSAASENEVCIYNSFLTIDFFIRNFIFIKITIGAVG